MTKTLLFGTFDRLHPGHDNLFKQARRVAATSLRGGVPPAGGATTKQSRPQIIAVIARDSTVKKFKQRLPHYSEKQRQKNLKKTGWVDEVFLGSRGDRYQIIKKIKPGIICLGYDQKNSLADLKKKIRQFRLNTKIVRLKSFHPKKYKSSKIANLKSKI